MNLGIVPKKLLIRIGSIMLMFMVFLTLFPIQSYAYYNRGVVSLSLGSNNVTVTKGSSVTVSVNMTPASRTGAVGCGMAQCPQTCGGWCGDEVTGECGCAGDVVVTRYAIAAIQNSNGIIAEATYSQSTGVINIKGLNVGTSQITVTGTLWQYTSSAPQTITINVVEKAQETTAASGGSNTGSGSTTSTGSSTTTSGKTVQSQTSVPSVSVNGETIKSTEETQSESETQTSTILEDTKHGKVEVVTLADNTLTGKDNFTSAMTDGRELVFQKLNESSNVIYSWTFEGNSITDPKDMDFSISLSDTASVLKDQTGDLTSPLFLKFAYHGDLPGKAVVTVNVEDQYKNGDTVSLYYLNEDTDEIELIAENLTVEAGYVSFTIDHCSSYAISKGMSDSSALSSSDSGSHAGIIIAGVIIILVIAGAVSFYFIRKKKRIA